MSGQSISDERLDELASDEWVGDGPTPVPFDYARPDRGKKWTATEAKAIELRHGHDPRLKCYPEFGCRAIEYEVGLVAAELVAARQKLAAIRENEAIRTAMGSLWQSAPPWRNELNDALVEFDMTMVVD
jgi:hypothetical protein